MCGALLKTNNRACSGGLLVILAYNRRLLLRLKSNLAYNTVCSHASTLYVTGVVCWTGFNYSVVSCTVGRLQVRPSLVIKGSLSSFYHLIQDESRGLGEYNFGQSNKGKRQDLTPSRQQFHWRFTNLSSKTRYAHVLCIRVW